MEGAVVFIGIWVVGMAISWSNITNRSGWICKHFSEETVKSLNENAAKKLMVSLIVAYFTIAAMLLKFLFKLVIRLTDGF